MAGNNNNNKRTKTNFQAPDHVIFRKTRVKGHLDMEQRTFLMDDRPVSSTLTMAGYQADNVAGSALQIVCCCCNFCSCSRIPEMAWF
jgi:hypothetical protein